MKRISMWVILGMSLCLTLNAEAGGVNPEPKPRHPPIKLDFFDFVPDKIFLELPKKIDVKDLLEHIKEKKDGPKR